METRSSRSDPPNSNDGIYVSHRELAFLLFQSLLLGATTAFSMKIVLAHFAEIIRPAVASSVGLFCGLLASYQSIRLYARAGGYRLGFAKWLVICIANALFVAIVLSVL
ncbi:MAG TPA: hypothetical protein VIL97_05110 [Thermoanaerobaculia bacterium]